MSGRFPGQRLNAGTIVVDNLSELRRIHVILSDQRERSNPAGYGKINDIERDCFVAAFLAMTT